MNEIWPAPPFSLSQYIHNKQEFGPFENIDWSEQERRNSIVNTLQLGLFVTNHSRWFTYTFHWHFPPTLHSF